jgi:hypothetical protein
LGTNDPEIQQVIADTVWRLTSTYEATLPDELAGVNRGFLSVTIRERIGSIAEGQAYVQSIMQALTNNPGNMLADDELPADVNDINFLVTDCGRGKCRLMLTLRFDTLDKAVSWHQLAVPILLATGFYELPLVFIMEGHAAATGDILDVDHI